MTIPVESRTASLSSLPLRPEDGAEELLWLRFEGSSLDRYTEGLRFIYRLAVFNDPERGRLVTSGAVPLHERVKPRPGKKSPAIKQSFIRHLITSDLEYPESQALVRQDSRRWRDARARSVRDGSRQTLLTSEEREVIMPEWAVEALAALLDEGPVLVRARLEAWGREFADGLDNFRSKKRSDDHSRQYPTPASVGRMKDVFAGLFATGAKRLRDRYGDQSPPWLKPWPGDWNDLEFEPHNSATPKRRVRTEVAVVKAAFAASDDECAKPFLGRFGVSDLEIVRDPEVFWRSFAGDRDNARTWLQNKHIARQIRDRALAAVAMIAGERSPELSSVVGGNLQLRGFRHPEITERHGVRDSYGAVFMRASAKARELGAHECLLPEPVCDRLAVWLFVYEVLVGLPPAGNDPVFLSDLSGRTKRALHTDGIRDAATRTLAHGGAIPSNARGTGAFNEIRRYTDTAILQNFDEWKYGRDGVLSGLNGAAVKEATLGHTKIAIDPYTYGGLSDAAGRMLLSIYGAEVIAETIWGTLGRRSGPGLERIRSELATQRALEQAVAEETRARAEIIVRMTADPSNEARAAFMVNADNRDMLKDRIGVQEALIQELFHDRDLWVELKDTEHRLTKAGLRKLRGDLLGSTRGADAPIRDFVVFNELVEILGVDAGTVRTWLKSDGSNNSLRCPWSGPAPVYRPHARLVLIAAAGLEEARINNGDRWAALRRLLATWPVGRGWHLTTGAKTKQVNELALAPIAIDSQLTNNLVAAAPSDCVRMFSFEAS